MNRRNRPKPGYSALIASTLALLLKRALKRYTTDAFSFDLSAVLCENLEALSASVWPRTSMRMSDFSTPGSSISIKALPFLDLNAYLGHTELPDWRWYGYGGLTSSMERSNCMSSPNGQLRALEDIRNAILQVRVSFEHFENDGNQRDGLW